MDQPEKILKGYKFRIYPTKEQETLLSKHFGACRYVWNSILETKKDAYLHAGIKLNYCDTSKGLTAIKKLPDLYWLKEVNSQSIQQELRKLDVAYSRFFQKISDFPAFKSKHDKQSFMVPQRFSYKDKMLEIPKFKTKIKVNQHREFGNDARILFVTISKNKAGKYFASFQVEENKVKSSKISDKQIGLDLGLKDLIVCSDGMRINNPKIAKKSHKKIEYKHRQFSKTKKGGKNRERVRLKLAKIYEKTTNKKQDFAHKLTSKIVDENQIICIEDLDVKGMQKNKGLARSIQDVSWGEVVRQLEYKSGWRDKTLVKVNQYFPSSKTCGNCGHIHQELKLSDREWKCVKCETIHDRDLNAARNILKQGQNIINSGLGTKSEIPASSGKKQKRKEPLKKYLSQGKKSIKAAICEAASL